MCERYVIFIRDVFRDIHTCEICVRSSCDSCEILCEIFMCDILRDIYMCEIFMCDIFRDIHMCEIWVKSSCVTS